MSFTEMSGWGWARGKHHRTIYRSIQRHAVLGFAPLSQRHVRHTGAASAARLGKEGTKVRRFGCEAKRLIPGAALFAAPTPDNPGAKSR